MEDTEKLTVGKLKETLAYLPEDADVMPLLEALAAKDEDAFVSALLSAIPKPNISIENFEQSIQEDKAKLWELQFKQGESSC